MPLSRASTSFPTSGAPWPWPCRPAPTLAPANGFSIWSITPRSLTRGDGGPFTVFGQVANPASLAVMDQIAAEPTYNASSSFGAAFSNLPLINYNSSIGLQAQNLVIVNSIAQLPLNGADTPVMPGWMLAVLGCGAFSRGEPVPRSRLRLFESHQFLKGELPRLRRRCRDLGFAVFIKVASRRDRTLFESGKLLPLRGRVRRWRTGRDST